MVDTTGACVVLIPMDNDLPGEVPGGQHVTLAYFGEKLSEQLYDDLKGIVARLALEARGERLLNPKGKAYFGDDGDAVVLEMESGKDQDAVALRDALLGELTPELREIFDTAEVWSEYRPHLTLGWKSEGYKDPKFRVPGPMRIEGIGIWNGTERMVFPVSSNVLMHYGILRKSGRYPWGSGENPNQRNRMFLDHVEALQKQGLTEAQVAQGLGMTTTALRSSKALAKNEQKKTQIMQARKLKDKQWSNMAIAREMGINESSVRALLAPATAAKNDLLVATSNTLKKRVDEGVYLDIGEGVENRMGISITKLNNAVAMLEEEGYVKHKVKVTQLGTGKETELKVLTPPGTTYVDVYKNMDKIKVLGHYTEDGGRSFLGIDPPLQVDPKRVEVRYGPDGGENMDGVIQVRRGVSDLSIGKANYAQVRIAVNGTHYLKGMAMYADDLPDGVDLRFNTNKKPTGNKLDAMKPLKEDPDNPFGAVVRQIKDFDEDGNERVISAMNIVNEEGKWGEWSRSVSSQMLSKQTPALAKQQLKARMDQKKTEFEQIQSLTNPAVKRKLLESFADDMDSSAVHLKAAALPRQATQVILPINSLKDNEIFAPNFNDGESVVLVRYPHGGIFEIPELRVNNRNKEANAVLKGAKDAVGINSNVASRLSGADFDGDTVLVIPNNDGKVKTSSPLKELEGFDPQAAYPRYEGMVPMTSRETQLMMGDVSNLITDMTIMKAPHSEIARAVRHSMVVIDAEKHKLDFRQSKIDHGIAELKKKYQGRSNAGAATLVSRSSSQQRVPERKPRPAAEGGPIDKETGARVYVDTGASYVNKDGKTVVRTVKSTKMAEAVDAMDLVSKTGTVIEKAYAQHANELKAMANAARLEGLRTKNTPQSSSAKAAYSNEVESLGAKLNAALQNKPLERNAQVIANGIVKTKSQANPGMEASELKKIKNLALKEARVRTGAAKQRIQISEREWQAIQSGAISNNMLERILDNADVDEVKQLAMPREDSAISGAVLARAQSMINAGYTQAEVAQALGISTTTVNKAIG